MPIQYAYINGAFAQLNNYSMSFGQAELFASRQRYALPIVQTRLLLAEQTSVQAQRCAEVGFQQQIGISAEQLSRIVSELVSRNRYFHDAYAELSVHPDLGGAALLQMSAVLHPQARFSPLRTGIACKIVRSIYAREYLSSSRGSDTENAMATCFLEPDGFIRHTNIGGIVIIKGNDCLVPSRTAADAVAPINELILHAAASVGLGVCNARISEHDLLEADEVLFPSAYSVLEWCSAYNRRRYFSRKFKLIARFISEMSGSR